MRNRVPVITAVIISAKVCTPRTGMDLRSLEVQVHMGRAEGVWRVEAPGQKEGVPFQEAGRWGRGVTRLASQHNHVYKPLLPAGC